MSPRGACFAEPASSLPPPGSPKDRRMRGFLETLLAWPLEGGGDWCVRLFVTKPRKHPDFMPRSRGSYCPVERGEEATVGIF